MAKLYASYGSNLNITQMQDRCPKAKLVTKIFLNDWKLVFRGVADIIKSPGSKVPIGIYEISVECENALDKYEKFPILYRKENIKITLDSNQKSVLTYVMNNYGYGPPVEEYFNIIFRGYNDWGISFESLIEALDFSLENDFGQSFKSHYWSQSNLITFNNKDKIIKSLLEKFE